MQLTLQRIAKKETYTIGRLYVDGIYVCDTIEDKDRGLKSHYPLEQIKKAKVYGETAIPMGTYTIDMDKVSPKFSGRSWAKPYGGKIPRLRSVPGFDGVLIHPGNTADDSLGCILVGINDMVGRASDSQKTFRRLMDDYLIPAHERRHHNNHDTMSTIVNIIMYLWQLPQNIAGLLVKVVVRSRTASVTERDGALIHSVRKFHGGVSLGRYVFCYCKPDRHNASRVMMAHEYGHSVQSRRWGWLYLPVVGLVSAVRCKLHLYKDGEYFEGWPEKQADDLGGVKRDANGKRFV